MPLFNKGCAEQTFNLFVLFVAAITGLSWLLLWIYNSESDQYPTGFAAGWFCFFGFCWALVLFRHARESPDDAQSIGLLFTGFFGCYFLLCAILMLCSFVALVAIDAGGTSVWPFIDFIIIVVLLIVFCRQESLRADEADDWGDDEGSPCGTFLCNAILVPVCIVLLFFHIALAVQALGAAQDAANIIKPGTTIATPDVDGVFTDMHILCMDNDDDDYDSTGLPTVLLESAINAPGPTSWALVQPLLARSVRVCSYDRRGYGWSWRGPNPRHVKQFNIELEDLLTRSGIPKSLVYVGWGYGGMAAVSYAHQYPDQIRGVVFVDALHPRASTDSAAADSSTVTVNVEEEFGFDAGPSAYDKLVRFIAPLGFVRMGEQGAVATGSLGYPFETLKLLPETAFEAYRAFLLGYYHPNVVVQEKREWTQLSADDVLKAPATKKSDCKKSDVCDLYDAADSPLKSKPIGVYSRKSDDADYKKWQAELAKLSSNALVQESAESDFLPMRDPAELAKFIVKSVAQAAVASGVALDVEAEAGGRKRSVTGEEMEQLMLRRVEEEIEKRKAKK